MSLGLGSATTTSMLGGTLYRDRISSWMRRAVSGASELELCALQPGPSRVRRKIVLRKIPLFRAKWNHLYSKKLTLRLSHEGCRAWRSMGLRQQLDKRFCRRSRVHRPGPEALGIHRHKGEPQALEDAGELGKHDHGQGALQFVLGNLNPGYIAVMANAKLA